MPCQICGNYSFSYPLCIKHYEMKKQNLVNKCSHCGVCFEGKGFKCSQCFSDAAKDKNLVYINRNAFQDYYNILFDISQLGLKFCKRDYDRQSYEKIKRLASAFCYELKKNQSNPIGVAQRQIKIWSALLYDIGKTGLNFCNDNNDKERYYHVLDLSAELEFAMKTESDVLFDPMLNFNGLNIDGAKLKFVSDRQIPEKMIEMIRRAKKEIRIASPWIRDVSDVLQALDYTVQKKRIWVDIVARPADNKKDEKIITTLNKSGYKIESEPILHAKLLLIDDDEILIGSANLIGTSLNRNYETALWTNHRKTVVDAKEYFMDLMSKIANQRLSALREPSKTYIVEETLHEHSYAFETKLKNTISDLKGYFTDLISNISNRKVLNSKRLKTNYFKEIRREFPRAYEKWTKEEEQRLAKMFSQGKTVNEMANILKRQTGGIRSRLKKLGLLPRYRS